MCRFETRCPLYCIACFVIIPILLPPPVHCSEGSHNPTRGGFFTPEPISAEFGNDVSHRMEQVEKTKLPSSSSSESDNKIGYPLSNAGVPRDYPTSIDLKPRKSLKRRLATQAQSRKQEKRTFSGNSYDDQFITDANSDDIGFNEKFRENYDDGGEKAEFMLDGYTDGHEKSVYENKLDYLRQQAITPVVYRFFPRSEAAKAVAASITARTGGSIPYILLVPNVDHWKVTGQELASRGYNVIAVGPKQPDDDEDDANDDNDDSGPFAFDDFKRRAMQGPALVVQLMDALRWTKVVLVGCDNEALMAIQAAVSLAASPDSSDNDRSVVGLLLCGRLEDAEQLIRSPNKPKSDSDAGTSYYYNRRLSAQPGSFDLTIDRLLEERLKCPFTIVSDGDTTSNPMPAATVINARRIMIEQLDDSDPYQYRHRTLIIGGGVAPHRRRPEYFAWVLSRFVEEQIAPSFDLLVKREMTRPRTATREMRNNPTDVDISNERNTHLLPVPWTWPEMLNEESFVVFGRVAATALFYAMAIKVVFYQYENLRFGIDMITLFRQTTIGTFRRAVLRTGSILFFYSRKHGSPNGTVTTGVGDSDDISEHDISEELIVNDGKGNDETGKQSSPLGKLKSLYSRLRNGNILGQNGTQSTPNVEIESADQDSVSESDNLGRGDENQGEDEKGAEEPDPETFSEKKRFSPIYWLDHVVT